METNEFSKYLPPSALENTGPKVLKAGQTWAAWARGFDDWKGIFRIVGPSAGNFQYVEIKRLAGGSRLVGPIGTDSTIARAAVLLAEPGQPLPDPSSLPWAVKAEAPKVGRVPPLKGTAGRPFPPRAGDVWFSGNYEWEFSGTKNAAGEWLCRFADRVNGDVWHCGVDDEWFAVEAGNEFRRHGSAAPEASEGKPAVGGITQLTGDVTVADVKPVAKPVTPPRDRRTYATPEALAFLSAGRGADYDKAMRRLLDDEGVTVDPKLAATMATRRGAEVERYVPEVSDEDLLPDAAEGWRK